MDFKLNEEQKAMQEMAKNFAEKKIGYFNSIGKSLSLKKIILTDSPEDATRKSYDKIILTRDPANFIEVIEAL